MMTDFVMARDWTIAKMALLLVLMAAASTVNGQFLNIGSINREYRSVPKSMTNDERTVGFNDSRVSPVLRLNLMPDLSGKNLGRLRRLLGRWYDPLWSSVEGQIAPGETMVVDSASEARMDLLLDTVVPEKQAADREWLRLRASCVMRARWEDMGNMFYPRYMRRGVCESSSGQASCSWPPGMQCRLAGSKNVSYLSWTCKSSPQPPASELKRRRRKREWSRKNRYRRENRRRSSKQILHNNETKNQQMKHKKLKSRSGYGYYNPVSVQKLEKRLTRMTQLWDQGYLCQWKRKMFHIQDRCECSCQ